MIPYKVYKEYRIIDNKKLEAASMMLVEAMNINSNKKIAARYMRGQICHLIIHEDSGSVEYR